MPFKYGGSPLEKHIPPSEWIYLHLGGKKCSVIAGKNCSDIVKIATLEIEREKNHSVRIKSNAFVEYCYYYTVK
jgi:hypothetical protein